MALEGLLEGTELLACELAKKRKPHDSVALARRMDAVGCEGELWLRLAARVEGGPHGPVKVDCSPGLITGLHQPLRVTSEHIVIVRKRVI